MTTAKKSKLERCKKYRRDCTKQCTVNYLQKLSIWMIYYIFKACDHNFLIKFLFLTKWYPFKNYEKCFLLHQKSSFRTQDIQIFVFSSSPLFFPVSHCLRGWSKKNLKIYDVINCLNKNLITRFVWYLEKEIRCDNETLSIDRELNKKHFYGKIKLKVCLKS